MVLDGSIVVSTHRYLVECHPHVNPYCCSRVVIKEEYMWLWGSFNNKHSFQGWSLQVCSQRVSDTAVFMFVCMCLSMCVAIHSFKAGFKMLQNYTG